MSPILQDALLMFEYLDRVNMNSPGAANKQLDRQVSLALELHEYICHRYSILLA